MNSGYLDQPSRHENNFNLLQVVCCCKQPYYNCLFDYNQHQWAESSACYAAIQISHTGNHHSLHQPLQKEGILLLPKPWILQIDTLDIYFWYRPDFVRFINCCCNMSKIIQTLEVDSVILEFGSKRVLHDIYVKCETNRITGLLGRNGTGKSCLLNIMFGTLKPLNGMVRINNEALLDSARKPADLMYLPQFGYIPKFLTLKRIFKDFKLDFFAFTNEFPEFKKHYHSRIGRLSGGERRIVEIYLIIVSATKFCLLDEPFSHVMPLHIDRIKDLIKREKKIKGIIVTDHLYEHIIDLCDEIYVIKDGETHLIKRVEEIESLGYAKITSKNGDV